MVPKLKLNIHLTKSKKRGNVYTLSLYMLEEHKCLIKTSKHVPIPRYSVHSRKDKPFIHCTKSLKRDNIATVCLYLADKQKW